METVITADAYRSPCTLMEESLPCENAAIAARRRRMEIRRFKMIASSGSFTEPLSKRSRSLPADSYLVRQGRGAITDCGPNCSLTLRPSDNPLENDERRYDTHTCQPFVCESAHTVLSSAASSSSSPGWDRTCTGNVMHNSSSGDEDSASSGSGSTSSGSSSISSDSTSTSQESSEADVGSTVTWAAGMTRSTWTAGITRSAPTIPGIVETPAAAEVLPEATETPINGGAEFEDRNSLYLSSRILIPSTSRSACCIDIDQCPPHGFVSVCGRRREMEDAVALIPEFLSLPCAAVGCDCRNSQTSALLHFFGVYDGHGGSQAAVFCAAHLHHALAEEVMATMSRRSNPTGSEIGWETQWQKAMLDCFLRMDAEVGGVCWRGGQSEKVEESTKCCAEPIAPETVGSTAVVAVVGSCQIIVANCGDSRAVLSRGGRAIALSYDHKPEREDEMARVEAAGGRVIFWNGYRVLGVLAMSRAIGDRYLKPFVIAEPEVTCTQRTAEDECLILASDGLWDVLSNEVVCELARKCLTGHRSNTGATSLLSSSQEEIDDSPTAVAAALLTKLALARGSSDNISVVVIDLKTKCSS